VATTTPARCAALTTGVTVKGYWDRIDSRHRRRWGKGETVYEPRHHLPSMERKPRALDHGRPFQDLQLPECFSVLRRRLESDRGHEGTKQCIAILRLLEKHATRWVAPPS